MDKFSTAAGRVYELFFEGAIDETQKDEALAYLEEKAAQGTPDLEEIEKQFEELEEQFPGAKKELKEALAKIKEVAEEGSDEEDEPKEEDGDKDMKEFASFLAEAYKQVNK